MLKVFLTVDTEAWPRGPRWRESFLREDIARDIHGITREGQFGIGFQMDVLDAHGLKGIFLVESLFPCAVGLESLADIVALIQNRGHEVQMHLHPEWLEWMPEPIIPDVRSQLLKDFSEEEQALLVRRGLENLQAAGARRICAFRAGNYGADFNTLHALSRNGIIYDTSHNTNYLDSDCGMRTEQPLLQPQWIHGVCEFPVTFFRDGRGQVRHAELCACSSQEMEAALLSAWKKGWYSFVIVSHSFELITNRKQYGQSPRADRIVIRRFERLCRFLAQHRDKFQTALFAEIPQESIPAPVPSEPLRCAPHHTALRLLEQAARRWL